MKKAERGYYWLKPSVQGYVQFLQDRAEHVTSDILDSKAKLTQAKAEEQQMKIQRLRGELVSVEEVTGAWSDVLRTLYSRMRSIPNKLARRIRLTRSDAEAQAVIKESIDKALEEAADAKIRILPAGQPDA